MDKNDRSGKKIFKEIPIGQERINRDGQVQPPPFEAPTCDQRVSFSEGLSLQGAGAGHQMSVLQELPISMTSFHLGLALSFHDSTWRTFAVPRKKCLE